MLPVSLLVGYYAECLRQAMRANRAFGPGSKFIPQTLELCLPVVWSLDTEAGDVSDGWGPGALSLTVPLCAWPPAWGKGALLLYIPNKRQL